MAIHNLPMIRPSSDITSVITPAANVSIIEADLAQTTPGPEREAFFALVYLTEMTTM
jgi:hypothetical protein